MTVRVERRGAVTILTLDRPPVNALDTDTWLELDRQLDQIESSTAIRCVVLAAKGTRAFSAGADIKEFPAFLHDGAGRAMALRIHGVQNRLERLNQVSIAAVEAAALGGGCELILACDLRVAGQHARFGFPEVTVGQFPGTGGTMRLPWLIGESRAKELLLTGRAVEAREAADIGLIHQVVPEGLAFEAALELAERLTQLPASGVAAIKQSVAAGRGVEVSVQGQRDSELSEAVFQSPEALEGYRAFVDKRPPVFSSTHEEQ